MRNTQTYNRILQLLENEPLTPSEIQHRLGEEWYAQRLQKFLTPLIQEHHILVLSKDKIVDKVELASRCRSIYVHTPLAARLHKYFDIRIAELKEEHHRTEIREYTASAVADLAEFEAAHRLQYPKRKRTSEKALLTAAFRYMQKELDPERFRAKLNAPRTDDPEYKDLDDDLVIRDIVESAVDTTYSFIFEHINKELHLDRIPPEDDEPGANMSVMYFENSIREALRTLFYRRQMEDLTKYARIREEF